MGPWLHSSFRFCVAVLIPLAVMAGCNDDEISKLPEATGGRDFLFGSWSSCHNSGTDERETVFLDGLGNGTDTIIDYSSTNTSCSAGAVVNAAMPFNYTLGAPVQATLSGGTVTARQWDYFFPGFTVYSIIYVNTGSSPNGMYIGDISGTNDGSTPALRPTALSIARIYLRQ